MQKITSYQTHHKIQFPLFFIIKCDSSTQLNRNKTLTTREAKIKTRKHSNKTITDTRRRFKNHLKFIIITFNLYIHINMERLDKSGITFFFDVKKLYYSK